MPVYYGPLWAIVVINAHTSVTHDFQHPVASSYHMHQLESQQTPPRKFRLQKRLQMHHGQS